MPLGSSATAFSIACDRLIQPLQRTSIAAIGPVFAVGGFERNGLFVAGERLVGTFQVMKRRATIGPGLRQVGLQGDGLVVAFDRRVEPPEVAQRIAAIAVALGEVRLELERLVVARDRLVQPPEVAQRIAPIAVTVRALGIALQRPVEKLQATFELLLLAKDEAEMVQRLEIVGLASQDVLVEFLRLRKLSPLVQGKSRL